jgi:hypothetical protein
MVGSAYKKADHQAIVKLNAAVKNQIMETKRREVTYEQVLEKAFFIEDVLNNMDNRDFKLRSNLIQPRVGPLGELIDKGTFLWYTILRPKFFSVLSLLSIILSL